MTFTTSLRPNLRLIGGRYDGYEGVYSAGLAGEDHFPDVLWIAPCTVPGCPCEGEDLAAGTRPSGRVGESSYLLHGCEEAIDAWITGVYRDADVCDLEISKQEIMQELAGVV